MGSAVIAVANGEGASGMTTAAVDLSAGSAASGRRAPPIDLDPRGHSGLGFGRACGSDGASFVLPRGDRHRRVDPRDRRARRRHHSRRTRLSRPFRARRPAAFRPSGRAIRADPHAAPPSRARWGDAVFASVFRRRDGARPQARRVRDSSNPGRYANPFEAIRASPAHGRVRTAKDFPKYPRRHRARRGVRRTSPRSGAARPTISYSPSASPRFGRCNEAAS